MGETQEEFAFECNISVRTLSRIEAFACRNVQLSTIIKIAKHTGLSICDLFMCIEEDENVWLED